MGRDSGAKYGDQIISQPNSNYANYRQRCYISITFDLLFKTSVQ